MLPDVATFREALEKDPREHGHIYAMFECEHWIPICVGIAKRVGFDEYISHWADPEYGAHCRCGGLAGEENDDMPVYVSEECPRCKNGNNREG